MYVRLWVLELGSDFLIMQVSTGNTASLVGLTEIDSFYTIWQFIIRYNCLYKSRIVDKMMKQDPSSVVRLT